MPWKDLHAEIAEEFGELCGEPDDIYDTGRKLESQRRRADPVERAREQSQNQRRRARRRQAKAAARPPCPQCKGPVVRVGKTGKVPTYCSPKCTRAAQWAKWYAKHSAEYNARRRKGPDVLPPCPECGGEVVRQGKDGPIPTYCSRKCREAAWRQKSGNRRRREQRRVRRQVATSG